MTDLITSYQEGFKTYISLYEKDIKDMQEKFDSMSLDCPYAALVEMVKNSLLQMREQLNGYIQQNKQIMLDPHSEYNQELMRRALAKFHL